jgi:hypothetical protein
MLMMSWAAVTVAVGAPAIAAVATTTALSKCAIRALEQLGGRESRAEVDWRVTVSFAEQHVRVPTVREKPGDVQALRGVRRTENRREPREAVIGRCAGARQIREGVRGLVVEIVEVVERELSDRDVRVIGKRFVGEHAGPQSVEAVCVLEFADGAVDDERFQRRITKLLFLQRARVLHRENAVASHEHRADRGDARQGPDAPAGNPHGRCHDRNWVLH